MRTRSRIALPAVIAAALIGSACSTGPTPPQPGTPAFYWAAARQMHRQGDFLKTQENLAQITKSDNQYTARARAWEMVVSAGIADGLGDLADIYEGGAKRNRANPLPFRRTASSLREMASAAALEFTESAHVFVPVAKDQPVPLEFEFPAGSAVEPPNVQKISNGMPLPDAEADQLRRAMIQRGVVMSVSRAVGAPDDTAKALEMFKAGNVQVQPNVFLVALAGQLYELSALFGSNKLDEPNRLQALCSVAKEALAAVPESKQSKDLSTKIEKALKKSKST